jgi:uncharacterized repeat protein (TIGR01451 family)
MAADEATTQDRGLVWTSTSASLGPTLRRPVIASALLLAVLCPRAARSNEPLEVVERWSAVVKSPRPGVLREQSVGLRVEALAVPQESGGPTPAEPTLLRLDLFGEETVLLERTSGGRLPRGGYSWLGRPLGDESGQAVFVVRGGRVYGSLRRPGSNLRIRPEGAASHRIEELEEAGWGEEVPDFEVVWTGEPATDRSRPTPLGGGSPEMIDVLVVYTEAALQDVGGTEAMEALVDLAEVETNASYASGGVAQRIRIVHAAQVSYIETNDSSTDLSRLRQTSDGFLDGVHALRDTYGADVVSLWLEQTSGCGRGYLMGVVSSSFASSAFNVCKRSCATGNLSFGHELGHNMGLRHDWHVDDTSGSPYSYNHGYAYPAGGWRTVMAYNTLCADLGGSCTRLQRFSNPAELEGGAPTGVPAGTSTACVTGDTANPPCDADNRQALDNTAATVADFRATTVLAVIAKEVDVSTAAVGDTLTYTLTVTNSSQIAATDIEIADEVPPHTILDVGSLSADAGTTGTSPGSIITWITGSDLEPGQSLVRTFQVTASEGGIVTNTATVDTGSATLTLSSNSVRTTIWEPVTCGFQDGFESGGLSHYWRVESTEDGRVRVLDDLPDTGSYSVVLDDSVSGSTTSIAALDLAADLAGQTDVRLDFRWAEAGDENSASDGVFLRQADGDPWVSVLPFQNVTDLVFQDGSIDLDQAAVGAGLALVDGFQIRFQFYDNFSFNPDLLTGSDGYVIDNVALTCICAPLELSNTTVETTVVESSDPVLASGRWAGRRLLGSCRREFPRQ